ncbi:MAG: metallophosphatase domain-containing protein [Pseudomonadales bacterium]|nr:metallophosphatase domain-containing protein [Pseudomonadales bacterium]
MKCVVISDTHGIYSDLEIPPGDVFIHAGDILGRGELSELVDFNNWLSTLPHKHKIVIAGNHDWCFERNEEESRSCLTNAIYLKDESVEVDGVKFYGSPWQPFFFNWAFNLGRGMSLKAKWDLIPDNIDVLITHGPALGILDQVVDGSHVGCEELFKAIGRIKPKYHIFGHIHEGYGSKTLTGCTHINASIMTERYIPSNKPITFEINK